MFMKFGYSIGKRIFILDFICSKVIVVIFFIKNSILVRRYSGRVSLLSLFYFSSFVNWVGRLLSI